MIHKLTITWFILVCAAFCGCVSTESKFIIHTQTDLELELVGYNGLGENLIYTGKTTTGRKQEINTPYRGLALLSFSGGQRYPVILGDVPFTLNISDPSQHPTFTGSTENDLLYKSLSSGDSVSEQYEFVNLMIQAKELLESTHSIKTIEELTAKKKEYHLFVGKHYDSLSHSDMIKRLITQYFMMHEYVNYHTEGSPATDIRGKYQQEVIAGVGNWIEVLKPYISEQEVLNYCVSLYYNRSMVTLASVIIDNFKDVAFCPGEEKKTFSFPDDDLTITKADGSQESKLADFKGNKIIAFVSTDCPVSMVETITMARQLARQKTGKQLIVAPMEKLSDQHLAMGRMISSGSLLFINDEKWREEALPDKIKLPWFVQTEK